MFKKGELVIAKQDIGALEIFNDPSAESQYPEYNYPKGTIGVVISVGISSAWILLNDEHPSWGFSLEDQTSFFKVTTPRELGLS
jgi:hypothetical protein